MNKLIVGCPNKNDLVYLKMMLDSLFNTTKSFDMVVVVDGGSTDGSKEFLEYLSKVNEKVELVNIKGLGPLEAYNKLFEIALERGCDLLLTQTDVIFYKKLRNDWLEEMKFIAYEDDNIGAVIPFNGGNISGPDYIDKFCWLGGWCTFIKHEVIKKLKGYDTEFPTGQYGVDIDFTYRLLKENYIIQFFNYFVDHHMLNSRIHDAHPDTEKHKEDCAIYFRKKWKLGEFK